MPLYMFTLFISSFSVPLKAASSKGTSFIFDTETVHVAKFFVQIPCEIDRPACLIIRLLLGFAFWFRFYLSNSTKTTMLSTPRWTISVPWRRGCWHTSFCPVDNYQIDNCTFWWTLGWIFSGPAFSEQMYILFEEEEKYIFCGEKFGRKGCQWRKMTVLRYGYQKSSRQNGLFWLLSFLKVVFDAILCLFTRAYHLA